MRTTHRAVVLVILLLAAVPSPSLQATEGGSSIEELSFMTGHWTRTTDGMSVEQVFLEPRAGTMLGMQRRTKDGETLVSYFFLIEQTAAGVVCRFKHFENDYTTYEDRNETGPRTFTLVESSDDRALFVERSPAGDVYMRFRLTDTDRLGIAVGSLEDMRADAAPESLHDRVGTAAMEEG